MNTHECGIADLTINKNTIMNGIGAKIEWKYRVWYHLTY